MMSVVCYLEEISIDFLTDLLINSIDVALSLYKAIGEMSTLQLINRL